MNPLLLFYNNETEREAVHTFLIQTLKDIAVERAFQGQDIGGIADAAELIETAFKKLDDEYGKVATPKVTDSR